MIIKAEALGDIKKTFFMIKNLSHVNACSSKVIFVGLTKSLECAVVLVDSNEDMEVVPAV